MSELELLELAQRSREVLAPYLPVLLSETVKAAGKEAGEGLAGSGLERARLIWRRLTHRDDDAATSLSDVADLTAADGDPDLMVERITELLGALSLDDLNAVRDLVTAPEGGHVTASGARSIAVGGSVSDSTLSTGDHGRKADS